MDLRQLKYFTRIVELQSLTAAAQSLHVAQPSLSQHLAKLEAELGVKLLERGARGVRSTAAGQRLYEQAKALLRQAQEVAARVRQDTDDVVGHVRLGLPASTSRRVAVPLLRALQAAHPGVTLEIVEGSTAYIAEMVQRHLLDLGVTVQASDDSNLDAQPLVVEELLLVGPPGSTLAGPVEVAQLSRLPLLLPAFPNAIRVRIEQLCNAAGLRYRVVAESAAAQVMVATAQAGMAWTILPWSAIEHEDPASLCCLPVAGRAFVRTLAVCGSRAAAGQPAGEAVRSQLHAVVAAMLAGGGWPHAELPGRR